MTVSIRRRTLVPAGLVAAAAAATALVLAAGSGPVAAAATAADPPRTVAVQGTGQVISKPDILRVTLAITKRSANVSSAMNGANSLVTKMRAALRKNGVADPDVQTTDFRVDSTYSKRNPGYIASQSLQVVLRDLPKAGRAIADAADAGGNATEIYGVSYDIEDRVSMLKKARDLAFADAEVKAQRYAKLAGRTLGAVRLVTEGNVQYDDSYGEEALQMGGKRTSVATAAKSSSVPLSAGSQGVEVRSSVTWNLR